MLFPSEGGNERGGRCVCLVPITLAHAGLFLSAFFSAFPWLSDVVWLLSLLSPLPILAL